VKKVVHALYPGSFDVLTLGHLDMIHRAARTFNRVTVAVAGNPGKRPPLFTVEERMEMLREATAGLPNVAVTSFPQLTVEYARSIGAGVIVRGLRAVSDFEFELQMAMMNETLSGGDVTTVFMAPSPQHVFLSSTLVKEIAAFGGDVSGFVPPAVEARLRVRIGDAR
jgi:pantetheine-phosphate adenylyltransferase